MWGTNSEIHFMSWLSRMENETSVLTALSPLYSLLFQRIFYNFHLNIPFFCFYICQKGNIKHRETFVFLFFPHHVVL